MPLIGGVLLDKYPEETGYRYLFAFIVVLSFFGLLSALAIHRRGGAKAST
jgi:hypothetical protein